jgi:hypothetical protein
MGYQIDRTEAVPDCTCKGLGVEFCMEATSVNASSVGPLAEFPTLVTKEDRNAFLREFMPIKYGSPLFSKLRKQYWERPHVKGKSLVFAIADFQGGQSMIMSRSGLPIYLYGYDHDWHKDEAGKLHITPRKADKHRWGTKEIPSGFFDQPGAEHISAVVFNNSGTISKFLRMGMLAGFGSRRVVLVREGTALDHDPNATEPKLFRHFVNSPEYVETWVEGFDVFHNPRALRPLDDAAFPAASHHRLLPNKQIWSRTPDWQPLGSSTKILVSKKDASTETP